jgi:hypothetical protein
MPNLLKYKGATHSGVNYEVDFIHLMDLAFCVQTAHCAPF